MDVGSEDQSLKLSFLETGSEDLCVEIYWRVFLEDTPVRKQGRTGWREKLTYNVLPGDLSQSGGELWIWDGPSLFTPTGAREIGRCIQTSSQWLVSGHTLGEDIALSVDLPLSDSNSE